MKWCLGWGSGEPGAASHLKSCGLVQQGLNKAVPGQAYVCFLLETS